MEISEQLREARKQTDLTQADVAAAIHVSRQTVSNWETGKSYPDIMSVVALSDLYGVSLDVLLKGDDALMKHLEDSTNTVKVNKQLIWAIVLHFVLVALLLALQAFIPANSYYLAGIFCLMVITSGLLLYQLIQNF